MTVAVDLLVPAALPRPHAKMTRPIEEAISQAESLDDEVVALVANLNDRGKEIVLRATSARNGDIVLSWPTQWNVFRDFGKWWKSTAERWHGANTGLKPTGSR